MTSTFDSETLEFPMPRAAACPFDPPPVLHSLREGGRMTKVRVWDGSTPWVVTRYADQRALLADPRISSDGTRPGYPHVSQITREGSGGSFVVLDDPEHARLRRMVASPFIVKRVQALRPAVQKIVDELIDRLLAGPKPVDLVEEFALPVPSLVICELLGVPYTDHGFFQDHSKTLLKRNVTAEQQMAAYRGLVQYLDKLISDKVAHPADDLLSGLAGRITAGELSREDAAQMGVLMLTAGHETTANMIALGTLALLQHPEQLAIMRDSDDEKTITGAVEEVLRYVGITQNGRRRVALADIEIGDQVIRAGDGLILTNDVANRDPAVFDDPDRLDLRRDARRHLAFGFGVHQCLGPPLARMELQVVYGTLYRRIPTLRLAVDLEQIPFKHDGLVYGVYELPLTW